MALMSGVRWGWRGTLIQMFLMFKHKTYFKYQTPRGIVSTNIAVRLSRFMVSGKKYLQQRHIFDYEKFQNFSNLK